VLTDIGTFGRFEVALGLKPKDVRPYQLQLARVLLSIFTLLSVASGLIYTAEHNVNPGINDYFDALYFGLTTLTTVGFGDIVPVTAQGKFVVCGSIIAGVAIIPAQTAEFVDALLAFQMDQEGKGGRRSSTTAAKTARPKGSTINGKDSMTNGKRPSGVPIDIPPIEESSMDSGGPSGLDTKMVCGNCGKNFHWSDAAFCWSCGAKMDRETINSLLASIREDP
jgi:hypothetical protein